MVEACTIRSCAVLFRIGVLVKVFRFLLPFLHQILIRNHFGVDFVHLILLVIPERLAIIRIRPICKQIRHFIIGESFVLASALHLCVSALLELLLVGCSQITRWLLVLVLLEPLVMRRVALLWWVSRVPWWVIV